MRLLEEANMRLFEDGIVGPYMDVPVQGSSSGSQQATGDLEAKTTDFSWGWIKHYGDRNCFHCAPRGLNGTILTGPPPFA